MLNRTTSRNFIAPRRQWNKIRNPNIEIRNKPEDINPNQEIPNGLVWNLLIFDHLKLFRISDFEFRIGNFVDPWRALWFDYAHHPESIEGGRCGCRLVSDSLIQNSTENFKYFWLDIRSLLSVSSYRCRRLLRPKSYSSRNHFHWWRSGQRWFPGRRD